MKVKKLLKIFHFHKWSSCPEDLINSMGCFEYEAYCLKCNAKAILGGVLTPNQLSELKFRKK